jgi:precorrin-6A/cobalt-precorrin-6A reductase
MILLLGGTSDAAPIAQRLSAIGLRVLVSKATDTPLEVGRGEGIECRSGPLDDESLAQLIAQWKIQLVVDATHPYAAAIHERACRVTRAMKIPCVHFARSPVIPPDAPNVEFAPDHASAAIKACRIGRPVLLTTGSNHLTPYVEQSRRQGVALIVRVLGNPQSLDACRTAGIADSCVLTGRGPFSVEENCRQIRAFGIGVVVTKDSGLAGGVLEKLEAATREGCTTIVVARPKYPGDAFTDIDQLMDAVKNMLHPR